MINYTSENGKKAMKQRSVYKILCEIHFIQVTKVNLGINSVPKLIEVTFAFDTTKGLCMETIAESHCLLTRRQCLVNTVIWFSNWK